MPPGSSADGRRSRIPRRSGSRRRVRLFLRSGGLTSAPPALGRNRHADDPERRQFPHGRGRDQRERRARWKEGHRNQERGECGADDESVAGLDQRGELRIWQSTKVMMAPLPDAIGCKKWQSPPRRVVGRGGLSQHGQRTTAVCTDRR